ncbi:YdcF family protein [Cognatilysobacter bugurensis]|uniref:Membrane protein n=1 Tax=Cognatilysobacter bugurensis TaxID=543356 RepID=A0A918SVW8_9GAMM|nr:YdcF family protein [Lysobacter bugurensis]GHA73980.1 membrane protein [Lysobacter bugurensis]
MIAELVSWALSPLNWLLIALLIAVLGARSRWRRVLQGIALGLAIIAFAASTAVVSNAIARRVESIADTPPHCESDPPDTVVVLAGGVDRLPRGADVYGVLSATSRRRIERGIEYWQAEPGRRLVLSGGPTAPGWVPLSGLMSSYTRAFGVPPDAVVEEDRSLTTWQNAQNVAALQPRLPRRIALATSAMHMNRAVLAFEAAGFEVCTLPADRRGIRVSLPGGIVPSTKELEKSDAALHELVGTLHYRWLRWRTARSSDQP